MSLFNRTLLLKRVFKIFVFISCMWIWISSMFVLTNRKYEGPIGFKKNHISAWIRDIYDLNKIIQNYDYEPGANGRSVNLVQNLNNYGLRQRIREGYKKYNFNEFVSNIIPVNRSLLDARDEWCKHQTFSKNLPNATVVICVFEEAWSTLIRTITSVINRTPPHLLDQIIIVDDFSSSDHLQKPLEDYIAKTPKVTLRRAPFRLGVVKARLLPIQEIRSPVIVYLDSHCECSRGWLEPLLQRIVENSSVAVTSVIDQIHTKTFGYIRKETHKIQPIGFTWDLKFSYTRIPYSLLTVRKFPAAPIKSPCISGAVLAISKDFFQRIGYYDTEMEAWGGENLELSLRIWMCGGSLEIVPCSHVGHIYKTLNEETMSVVKKNLVRVAEVWLDDYAKYYYERIGYEKGNYGNVSERIQLRQKLNCKPFKWYLENIYPQLEVPKNLAAKGQIFSTGFNGLCIDAATLLREYNTLNLKPCHFEGGKQFWTYTAIGEIRRDKICLDYSNEAVSLMGCTNATSQVWLYFEKDQRIRHMLTKKCLHMVEQTFRYRLVLAECTDTKSQKWVLENFNFVNLEAEIKLGIAAYVDSS